MSGTAFVFSPDASYDLVTAGHFGSTVMYVASVSGPWKIFVVLDFDEVSDVKGLVDEVFKQEGGSGDPETALTGVLGSVRHNTYYTNTALVRIHTAVPDPEDLIPDILKAIEVDEDDREADVVMGDFDILACVGDDDESELARKIMAIRKIKGITRTVSLRVIDYRSRSGNAPEEKRLPEIT
jgi:hypothetical protein